MGCFFITAVAMTTFFVFLTYKTADANAVVCADGVVRVGCVRASGEAVVHTGPVYQHVDVNGVCARRSI
jgi:hypothetical protein